LANQWDYLSEVTSFRFMVEIGHVIVAGFSEVSGLEMETEVFEYAEGGLNEYTHRFATRTKLVPIVLKRGISYSTFFWEWYDAVRNGIIGRMDGSIILFDSNFEEFRRWDFTGAYPTKWKGPDLNANTSEVAIEMVELTHNGFKLNRSQNQR